MAKVKLGALAQDVRGTIAGQTFSRNKGGSYVRQKVSPTQPETARQTAQRGILSQVAQLWAATVTATRSLWYTYAENNPVTDVFGDSLKLNGAAAFQKLNATLLTCNVAAITTPPTEEPIPHVTLQSIAAVTTTGITATFNDNLTDDRQIMVFGWVTPPNQGAFPKSKLRLLATAPGEASPTVTIAPGDIINPLVTLVAGQRLHVRIAVVEIASGRVTGTATASAIITAP